MADIDRDLVINAMAQGEDASKIAQRFGVPIKHVKETMRQAVAEMADADTLREEWFLEDHRLKTLGLRFYEIALRDNDPQAAVVFLKASERRATLGGANAPTSYAIHVMNQAPVKQLSSSERIENAMDRLLGIGDRERELRDRDDLTEDERTELVAIEDAREAERQRKYQEERQRRLKLVGK
jgi:hypothetical protein